VSLVDVERSYVCEICGLDGWIVNDGLRSSREFAEAAMQHVTGEPPRCPDCRRLYGHAGSL
jgi:hypothetical protein